MAVLPGAMGCFAVLKGKHCSRLSKSARCVIRSQALGGRKQQEDRFVSILNLNEAVRTVRPEVSLAERRSFFAVFDGFGGYHASEWLKKNFHQELIKDDAFETDPAQARAAPLPTLSCLTLLVQLLVSQKQGSLPPLTGAC